MSDNATGGDPSPVQTTAGWQAVVEDMAATSQEYRERGWTTLELHPGDSVLVDSEFRTGLDVLLPGPEYDELESLLDDCSFTDSEVFRAEREGLVYLLVVEKDPDREVAVFVPAYYDLQSARSTLETIDAAGELRLFCRRLNDDYVEFVHDEPSPFLPDV
ncbi:DUF7529 family protein [Halalkalicoccus jeotgali]|uniref:Uncharacterized protein n=1 Tax=Halalkalicoccus jeotgali (strain DSM 18796 / CECT 7217 / JCM 14584 / KCTC 4019 / B3) TaxID=795797 RepID=D8J6K7_HALJB|nr:hypothetical protein [Halalkalicoccus jeotgali]ADJ13884.1 hypothetical protein HacjB3_02455 [Halalkalicoccus jeotgali B3]ELY34069.1 hypothetical protein C497_16857 [Halalkalicoccus jeotgali B3]